jgi:hypothetical protein
VSRFFASGGQWRDQQQAIEDAGRRDTVASAALYCAGGALAVGGTSLLILSWKRERR